MGKALEDVVVLDLTRKFWGALGAALLADFGARVIRVEPLPEAREERGGREHEEPRPPWDHRFELANRNKLSLAVKLDEAAGREILEGLVRQADVFVTDCPRAFVEGARLDYATLASLKPDIIYARGTGFGPKGPDRDLPALDELAAARTGMMPIMPQPDQPPVFAASGQMYTVVMLAFGVVTALHHRHETGEGQEVDVSLLAGNMYGASLDLQAFLAMGGERFLNPVSRLDAGNPMSGVLYQASDRGWVCLTMPDTDRWWPAFAPLVELDTQDPRFDDHEKRCGENRLEMIRVLDDAFRQKPSDHWRRVLTENQLSADVIEEYTFPAEDEQARRNRYILELEHPHLGSIKTLGFPIFMSDTPARLDRLAPCLGQHSAQILQEMLDYSEGQIEDLQAKGIIA